MFEWMVDVRWMEVGREGQTDKQMCGGMIDHVTSVDFSLMGTIMAPPLKAAMRLP